METKKTNGRIIAGVLVLIVGIALLVNNFDFIQFPIGHYIFSWKTLLIGIGIVLIVARERLVEGVFLIGLGSIFWLPEMFNYQIALNQIFWPAFLVLFGAVLILKATRTKDRDCLKPHHKKSKKPQIVDIAETDKIN